MTRWWVLVGALVAACRDDSSPAPAPRPHTSTSDPALDDNLRSLADRPVGRLDHTPGVPLDDAVLGKSPHTFGSLSVISPGADRPTAMRVPDMREDGGNLVAPTGVADVSAVLTFDRVGKLDLVTYYLPAGSRQRVAHAWGPSDDHDTWLDPAHGIRADAGDDRPTHQVTLSIEAYRPFASLLGHNADGLADDQPTLVGAQRGALLREFGAYVHSAEIATGVDEAHTLEVLLPATDACKVATSMLVSLDRNDTVERLVLRQCYADEPTRRAVLATIEKAWGRATPGRSATDRPTFEFTLPKRHASVTLVRSPETLDEVWEITITP